MTRNLMGILSVKVFMFSCLLMGSFMSFAQDDLIFEHHNGVSNELKELEAIITNKSWGKLEPYLHEALIIDLHRITSKWDSLYEASSKHAVLKVSTKCYKSKGEWVLWISYGERKNHIHFSCFFEDKSNPKIYRIELGGGILASHYSPLTIDRIFSLYKKMKRERNIQTDYRGFIDTSIVERRIEECKALISLIDEHYDVHIRSKKIKLSKSTVYANLSWEYLLKEDFDNALSIAKNGIELYPDDFWNYTNLILALFISDHIDEAKVWCNRLNGLAKRSNEINTKFMYAKMKYERYEEFDELLGIIHAKK